MQAGLVRRAEELMRMACDLHQTREWRILRMQCYRRDRAARAECGICKGGRGPIDYDAPPSSHDLAYEPDHIRPVSRYPQLAFDASNIQAAHRACNRRKGDKPTLDNMGSPTRAWDRLS